MAGGAGGRFHPACGTLGHIVALKAIRLSCIAAVLAGIVACAVAPPPPPAPALDQPIAMLGRLPSIEQVELSPDGTRLAVVKTMPDDQRVVAVVGLTERKLLATAKAGNVKLRGIGWADDDHLLIFVSTTEFMPEIQGTTWEWYMLSVLDVTDCTVRPLFKGQSTGFNAVIGEPVVRWVDGQTLLFVEGLYGGATLLLPALIRIEVATGDETLLAKGGRTTRGWFVDEAGQIAAEEDYDDTTRQWTLRLRRNGSLEEVASGHDASGGPVLVGLDASGDALVVATHQAGESVFKRLSLRDGSWQSPDLPAAGIVRNPTTSRVIGTVSADDQPRYAFFDAAVQARWDRVRAGYPQDRVHL